ncbi:sugar transferase [Lacibacter sp. MH-610]|uniref:sugar transferase n=1 Tax=Lacibacter sp. MH-610 TaxID=3020883 RepID=UPI0038921B3C
MTPVHHTFSGQKREESFSASSAFAKQLRSRTLRTMMKRFFDVVVASFLIVTVLSWLVPIVSILILIDSRSPVFFRQRRVGRFGKTFYCLKFRTMYNNIEADFKQASDDDPRITRLGHFLRKTNIDELPQLFNVLIGDMSIIGPRPHMLKDCKDFNEVVKNYKLRSFVKPGITGLAQIKGFRGPTTDDLSIIHRFRWDLFYIRHSSMAFDLSILAVTVYQAGAHFISNIVALFSKRSRAARNVEFEGKKQIAA